MDFRVFCNSSCQLIRETSKLYQLGLDYFSFSLFFFLISLNICNHSSVIISKTGVSIQMRESLRNMDGTFLNGFIDMVCILACSFMYICDSIDTHVDRKHTCASISHHILYSYIILGKYIKSNYSVMPWITHLNHLTLVLELYRNILVAH